MSSICDCGKLEKQCVVVDNTVSELGLVFFFPVPGCIYALFFSSFFHFGSNQTLTRAHTFSCFEFTVDALQFSTNLLFSI